MIFILVVLTYIEDYWMGICHTLVDDFILYRHWTNTGTAWLLWSRLHDLAILSVQYILSRNFKRFWIRSIQVKRLCVSPMLNFIKIGQNYLHYTIKYFADHVADYLIDLYHTWVCCHTWAVILLACRLFWPVFHDQMFWPYILNSLMILPWSF